MHKQSEGRWLRIVDSAHLDVAGRNGAVRQAEIAVVLYPSSPPSLLRLLVNTKLWSEEASDGAGKEIMEETIDPLDAMLARLHLSGIRDQARQPARRGRARTCRRVRR